MFNFNVWIVLLTPLYGERVIAKLVKNDYAVQTSVEGHLFVGSKDEPCRTMAITISHRTVNDEKKVYEDIIEALNLIKAKYFSVIVVKGNCSAYFGRSNIKMSELQAIKTNRLQKRNHLRLVKLEEKKLEGHRLDKDDGDEAS